MNSDYINFWAAIIFLITAILGLFSELRKSKTINEIKAEIPATNKPKRQLGRWILWRIWPTFNLVVSGGLLISFYLGKNIPATRSDVVLAIAAAYIFRKCWKYLEYVSKTVPLNSSATE
jgi:hypothetical protein